MQTAKRSRRRAAEQTAKRAWPTIYLARHCKTSWNLERRIQGSIDMPLCNKGIAEATALIPLIRPYRFDRIVSSPYKRAFQTAQIYAHNLKIPVTTHAGFRELDHGRWEGKRIEALMRMNDSRYNDWVANKALIPIPDGSESMAAAGARAIKALVDVAQEYSHERVLIILHKHIRAILNCRLNGYAPEAFGRFIEEGIKPHPVETGHLHRIVTPG
jgi:broad specificity phosphatase PhoE